MHNIRTGNNLDTEKRKYHNSLQNKFPAEL